MVDHRRLQRALFRMQHDPSFAARLRAGDAGAAVSTALGAAELAWLRAADPVALAADRDGRRAAQLLRNVASEFRLSVAIGPEGDGAGAWLAAFPASPQFHRAVSADEPLPLAFAAFAEERAERAASAPFRAFVALEAAMARARRAGAAQGAVASRPAIAPGAVVRAPTAWLVELPAGTHDAASAWTRALEGGAGRASGAPAIDVAARETLLLAADPAADARFGRLRPLRVEPLPALVAAFLRRAERPLDRTARAAFAAAHGLAAEEVEGVVAEYVAEGVLLVAPERG